LLLDAIAAASYTDGDTLVVDRAGVREHLNGVTGYSGLIGTMACDAYGDCSSSKITVIQNIDVNDYEASTANVVYEYAPLGSSQVGDIAARAATLAAVCPSPLVIQTDWFPEAEHGALYQMITNDYVVDADNKVVSGPGQLGGQPLGIDIEVRTGGPAIGWSPVSAYMYTDDSIHLGYGSTDEVILGHADAPMLSVISPLEKNPQMVMWDKDAHPDVKSLADLGEKGVTINIFAGGVFSEVFVAEGIWSEDQLDPSYDGSPARFTADPTIAQQGFASAEPYVYLNEVPEYGKTVELQLLHDAGYPIYSQTLAIRPSDLEALRPCLELIVPVVQHAIVEYDAAPERANKMIVDAVTQFEDFWVYDMDLAAFSVQAQRDLGLVGNGGDGIVGNMDPDRVQTVIDKIVFAGLDIPAGLSVEDIMTNEFIDTSIGFPIKPMEGALAGVCPDPLIIQTDWHAQAEHGPTYELLGQGYEAANGTVTGRLVASGEVDTGIGLQIVEGGPAIGYQQVSSQMYQERDIFLGYASTDGSVGSSLDQPIVNVMAIMEINPQMIMWNPEHFPGVEHAADLPGDTTLLAFWGAHNLYWLIDEGLFDASQIDQSYDGSVTRWVASDGAIALEAYASTEPYIYEVETPEYGKPVKYELLHDMGFQTYSQNYGVRPERLVEDRACLELLVPILQQAAIDYVHDGAETNATIVDVNAAYDDGWVYESGLADFANAEMGRLGLIGNGPDGTVGKFDMERVQGIVDIMIPVFANPEINTPILEGITAADIVTNEFLDSSIGFE
jgi:hypothetical protein